MARINRQKVYLEFLENNYLVECRMILTDDYAQDAASNFQKKAFEKPSINEKLNLMNNITDGHVSESETGYSLCYANAYYHNLKRQKHELTFNDTLLLEIYKDFKKLKLSYSLGTWNFERFIVNLLLEFINNDSLTSFINFVYQDHWEENTLQTTNILDFLTKIDKTKYFKMFEGNNNLLDDINKLDFSKSHYLRNELPKYLNVKQELSLNVDSTILNQIVIAFDKFTAPIQDKSLFFKSLVELDFLVSKNQELKNKEYQALNIDDKILKETLKPILNKILEVYKSIISSKNYMLNQLIKLENSL